MINQKAWLDEMKNKRLRLYAQYGKQLETQYNGQFLAIGFEGQTILGEDDGDVLGKAVEQFGRGNFVLTRIGHENFGTWMSQTE